MSMTSKTVLPVSDTSDSSSSSFTSTRSVTSETNCEMENCSDLKKQCDKDREKERNKCCGNLGQCIWGILIIIISVMGFVFTPQDFMLWEKLNMRPGSDGDDVPGYEYHPYLKGCLKLNLQPTDWQTARNNCLAEDGRLASAWTELFAISINSIQIRTDRFLPVLFSGAHSGLHPVNGEATSLELDRCGAFFANGSTGEVSCVQRLPYVCYAHESASVCVGTRGKPGYEYHAQILGWLKLHQEPATWLAARVNCHMEGYEFSKKTGSCYKFHNIGLKWLEAQDVCVKEGALLAVFNSRIETDVLVDIFKRYPKEVIHSEWNNFISVGIYWKEGVWKTVDGNIFEEGKGYAKWGEGEPRYMNSFPYVFMNRIGELSNRSNTYTRPFICEKKSAMAPH